MKEESESKIENAFASACVANGLRLDGRRRTGGRRARISLGAVWGEAEVTLDRTRAISSTTVEAVAPSPGRPNEGTVQIAVALSPASSEAAARDAAGLRGSAAVAERAAELRTAVERLLHESRAIDTEALCIVAGSKVWSVHVRVDLLDDDGNAVDASVLAATAALLHARHPDVSVSGRDVVVHSMDEREPVPLPVHHVPVASTFAVFPAGEAAGEDVVVLDPTRREEFAAAGAITLAFNAQGEVCAVYKAGGAPIEGRLFVECAEIAARRAVEVTRLLGEAMKESASLHPMATIRPVLSQPEPKAADVAPAGLATAVRQPEATAGVWNAKAVADAAPPQIVAMDTTTNGGGKMHQGVSLSKKERKKLLRVGKNAEEDDMETA